MSRRKTRRFAPVLLIAALAAFLVLAATAAAETRTGESTSTYALGPTSPEATIAKGAASYDATGGNVVFTITTGAEPQAESEGEPSEVEMVNVLFTTGGECSSGLTTVESLTSSSSPAVIIENRYAEPNVAAFLGSFASIEGGAGGSVIPATKSVAGTTTTLSTSSTGLAGKEFNCALVLVEQGAGAGFMAFPIKAPPPPPTPPTPPTPPAPPTPAAPAPAPPALSIAKSKPLKLKVDRWKTVQLKVTNTGATATTQGSLRVKPAKGVLVKPEVQKLPILVPHATWTVPVQVELTEKAKPKSTLALTGIASGVSAKSSLVVKLTQ